MMEELVISELVKTIDFVFKWSCMESEMSWSLLAFELEGSFDSGDFFVFKKRPPDPLALFIA